jgi:hypothetical protein
MGKVFEFLIELAPDLVRLGQSLYDLFDGNVEEARRNIEDRRQEIEQKRAARDRELDARFPTNPDGD